MATDTKRIASLLVSIEGRCRRIRMVSKAEHPRELVRYHEQRRFMLPRNLLHLWLLNHLDFGAMLAPFGRSLSFSHISPPPMHPKH